MSEKKPTPVLVAAPRLCPVCGKPAYSLAGEHPQCALRRADAAFQARMAKRKAKKEALREAI